MHGTQSLRHTRINELFRRDTSQAAVAAEVLPGKAVALVGLSLHVVRDVNDRAG